MIKKKPDWSYEDIKDAIFHKDSSTFDFDQIPAEIVIKRLIQEIDHLYKEIELLNQEIYNYD